MLCHVVFCFLPAFSQPLRSTVLVILEFHGTQRRHARVCSCKYHTISMLSQTRYHVCIKYVHSDPENGAFRSVTRHFSPCNEALYDTKERI